MLFNSYTFLFLFLPLTLLVFWFLQDRWNSRHALGWLVVASLFYYGWWEPRYLGLILVSVAFNYSWGRLIAGRRRSTPLLEAGILINLVALGWFKYAGFLLANYNQVAGTDFHLQTIVLPLAISFFTFQQIAYLVDIHRGESAADDVLHYLLFVTFFPQLIAGPVVQQQEMLPQYRASPSRGRRSEYVAVGLSFFLLGLFKKVVLADGVAVYAAPVFEAADGGARITFFEAWGGALAYAYQIYFDFSGYSDMAIGLARMFGFRLPVNFNSPYQATGIIDFWRRWHMTLSRFLKAYLYIPLGGNRRGTPRRYFNLMATMVLGGLWHGAGWNFVIWGALHGGLLVLNTMWQQVRPMIASSPARPWEKHLGSATTFVMVVMVWIFFRAETLSGAVGMLRGALGLNGLVLDERLAESLSVLKPWVVFAGEHAGYFNLYGVPWLVALSLVCWYVPNLQKIFAGMRPALDPRGGLWQEGVQRFPAWGQSVRWAWVVAVLGVLAITHMSRVMEFVYYRF
ncbi:MAG: MBOAT family O-acyltransferase [Candidatus Krumholzibacteria bacterium]|nr:MBOAT family O-acyltransferase [Candidatus Krumholzibacteria bacterium]